MLPWEGLSGREGTGACLKWRGRGVADGGKMLQKEVK